jgi:hypothetical protein
MATENRRFLGRAVQPAPATARRDSLARNSLLLATTLTGWKRLRQHAHRAGPATQRRPVRAALHRASRRLISIDRSRREEHRRVAVSTAGQFRQAQPGLILASAEQAVRVPEPAQQVVAVGVEQLSRRVH